MSAIFGVLTLDGEPARREWMERLLEPLARLGPDRQGFSCQAETGLGHCLLAVTPESELERQPLFGGDGRAAVVFAGSLYGRAALSESLGLGASESARMPDSALLLRAYERWREGCLERLDGEFALAVMDRRRGGLLLAQSRLARFPLYTVRTARLFGFATRIVPLLSLPGVQKELDPSGFVRAVGNFAWKEADLSATCFRGIESMAPATALWVGAARSGSEGRRWTYWQPDPDRVTNFASEAEVYEAVRDRMRQSVRERVRGRHPVACLLSGGLDSSSIACLAAAELAGGRQLVAIASALPLDSGPADGPDERPFIEVVRRHLGIPVEYVTPPPDPSPWEFPDSLFEDLETATLSPRHFLYRALCEVADSRGARVLLDGCLGELGPSARWDCRATELFVGGRWRAAAREIGVAARQEGVSWARAARRHALFPLLRPAFRGGWPGPRQPRGPQTAGLFAALDPAFLRSTGVRSAGGGAYSSRVLRAPFPGGEPRLGAAAAWLRLARPRGMGPGFPIAWEFPLRDLDLWEYCRGLPLQLACREGWNRYLIRAAMEGILPEEIRWRTSKGPFSPDYFTRLRQALLRARALCEAVPPGSVASQVLDLAWLRKALAGCEAAPARLTSELAFACQGSLAALQFLDWFERLPGRPPPVAGPTQAERTAGQGA